MLIGHLLMRSSDAFQKRTDQWYLRPVQVLQEHSEGHGGFAALAMCCIMIDCMCQFEGGKVISNRSPFTDFVESKLPRYKRSLNPAITFPRTNTQNQCYDVSATGVIRTRQLRSIADVLYYVFRCGILHSAHAPLVGVISGLQTKRFSVRKRSLAQYGTIGTSGSDCPVVVIDPWKLFADIKGAFESYLHRLRKSRPTS
jgi:hypothetical protein